MRLLLLLAAGLVLLASGCAGDRTSYSSAKGRAVQQQLGGTLG